MKKAIPLVMSALMATSFIGVPAVAQAKTPAARTASEKQETQYDLSGCDLRPRNYRSNFIEGNGPDKDTFVVVDRNTNREVDKSQYKFTFQNCLKRDIGKKQARVFPPKGKLHYLCGCDKRRQILRQNLRHELQYCS